MQEFLVNNLEWIKNTFQFTENFLRKFNEECYTGYFLKVDVWYLKKLHGPHNDLPFLPERMKFEKVENSVANLHDKTDINVIHVIHYAQKKF